MAKKHPMPGQPKEVKWSEGRFAEFVERACEYFKTMMFCQGYALTTEYCETITIGDADEGKTALASVAVDHPYMRIKLLIGKSLWEVYEKGKYRDVMEVLCHEFCHVMTAGMYKWAERGVCPATRGDWVDEKEHATTWVARVVMQMVPEGMWKGEENAKSA